MHIPPWYWFRACFQASALGDWPVIRGPNSALYVMLIHMGCTACRNPQREWWQSPSEGQR